MGTRVREAEVGRLEYNMERNSTGIGIYLVLRLGAVVIFIFSSCWEHGC
jgi:hypothetical protein